MKAEDEAAGLSEVPPRGNLPGLRSEGSEDGALHVLNKDQGLSRPSLTLTKEGADGDTMHSRVVQQPPGSCHSAGDGKLWTKEPEPGLRQQQAGLWPKRKPARLRAAARRKVLCPRFSWTQAGSLQNDLRWKVIKECSKWEFRKAIVRIIGKAQAS
mmetsp:Transcript_28963/g.68233  ORF Transcript_28963/g.68233 Transcript_28963/m.68233 type:complete len:156 (-) Transcript_28963:239-706(-)